MYRLIIEQNKNFVQLEGGYRRTAQFCTDRWSHIQRVTQRRCNAAPGDPISSAAHATKAQIRGAEPPRLR